MNILVVAGTCLRQNTSANLCHITYINGLLDLGHNVDLITVEEQVHLVDKSIQFPKVCNSYTYNGVSLYEKISIKKKKILSSTNTESIECCSDSKISQPRAKSFKKTVFSIFDRVKKIWWYSYGPYCTDKVWSNRASKFSSNKKYDYVISLAFPSASHRTVNKLIKKRRIIYDKWIQIWEDPWSTDLLYYNGKFKIIENEERRIIRGADKIVYVSPITLINQQKLFPDSSSKMTWFPLPSYYSSVSDEIDLAQSKTYGYFGNYIPHIRNLKPFYNIASEMNLDTNICGIPSDLFVSTETVKIYPRLPLDKLKLIEDKTNVLIFLCNLRGGQIPGKIYQYAASNKIILFILDGTEEEKKILKEYFEKYNRFIFCDNNEESIKQTIYKIENNDFNGVENKMLTCFNAKDIIKNILDSVKD